MKSVLANAKKIQNIVSEKVTYGMIGTVCYILSKTRKDNMTPH